MTDESRHAPTILMLTTNFPRRVRGDTTGTFVYDLAEQLAQDHDVLVIAPHDHTGTRSHQIITRRLSVARVRYFWPQKLQRLAYGFGIPDNLRKSWLARIQLPLLMLAFMFAAIRHGRTRDIVVCHWSLTALAALPLRWFWRIPIVLVAHGGDIRLAPRTFTRWLVSRVDWMVSAHDDLIEYVQSLDVPTPLLRIRNLTGTIPNTNAETRLTLRDELGVGHGPLVLFVGRLTEFKDPLTFVEAVPHVLARAPEARCLLVGDGPLRTDVEIRIDALGLAGYVKVAGHRSDVLEILRLATVFVAVSPITNLWSTTLIEAMHAGVPCVVTDSGGASETLSSGIDSMLVPSSDPRALADAIVELLNDDELRNRLAEGARRLLQRQGFLREQIKAQWTGLIAKATAS